MNPQTTNPLATPGTDPNASMFSEALKTGATAGYPTFPAPVTNTVKPLPVSTTTISNANKIGQVPQIVNTTNQFSKTGITTDANGTATYSNGTMVPQPAEEPKTLPASKSTVSSGGYNGDVYVAPGAPLPLGVDGKPVQLTPTSPTDDQILNSLNSLKASNDAITASIIDGIHQQYAQLRQQQESANRQQQASVKNALLMGGVTGKGSSSQYAPISSSGIISAQINYGLQNLSDLTNKENMAIVQAQQAGQQNNYQLMDRMNSYISKVRDEKVAAAVKVSDQIAAQNAKLAEEQLQADKDNAIAELYQSGITEPSQILRYLKSQGMTITAKEVAETLKNVGPDLDREKFELEKQQSIQDFVVKNNITKPFFLIGNSVFDTATREPISYEEYLKLTGQPLDTPQTEADYSFLQSDIQTPEERQLAQSQAQFNAKMAQDQAQFEANYSLDERKTLAAENAANSIKKNLVKVNGTDYLINEQGELTNPEVPQAQVSQVKIDALKSAQELLNKLNSGVGNSAVGTSRNFYGALLSKVSGTDAKNFSVQFKNLKDLISLDNVKLLKGQGAVSDAERELLANASSKLDLSQSESEFKKSLEDIIKGLSGDESSTPLGSPPEGQIWVKDKASGQWGSIPTNEFDSSKYEKGDFSQAGNASASKTGMRTDRHNNPTAFTTDIAKLGGLKEGVDYVAGDTFSDGKYTTARLLGDAIAKTIQVIDKIGFFTQSGKPRWTYTNSIPATKKWNSLSYEEKKNVIKQMYTREGGSQLLNYFA